MNRCAYCQLEIPEGDEQTCPNCGDVLGPCCIESHDCPATTICENCSRDILVSEVQQCAQCGRDGLGNCCIGIYDHKCSEEG